MRLFSFPVLGLAWAGAGVASVAGALCLQASYAPPTTAMAASQGASAPASASASAPAPVANAAPFENRSLTAVLPPEAHLHRHAEAAVPRPPVPPPALPVPPLPPRPRLAQSERRHVLPAEPEVASWVERTYPGQYAIPGQYAMARPYYPLQGITPGSPPGIPPGVYGWQPPY